MAHAFAGALLAGLMSAYLEANPAGTLATQIQTVVDGLAATYGSGFPSGLAASERTIKVTKASHANIIIPAGLSVNANEPLIIEAEAGAEWYDQAGPWRADSASGATIAYNGGSGPAIDANLNHLEVRGLQIINTNQFALWNLPLTEFENGICEDSLIYSKIRANINSGLFKNCLFYCNDLSSTRYFSTVSSGGYVEFQNCTLAQLVSPEASDQGIRAFTSGTRQVTVRRTAIFNVTELYSRDIINNGDATLVDNATSASTGLATGTIVSGLDPAAQYENLILGSEDFSLIAGNALQGAASDGGDIGFVPPNTMSAPAWAGDGVSAQAVLQPAGLTLRHGIVAGAIITTAMVDETTLRSQHMLAVGPLSALAATVTVSAITVEAAPSLSATALPISAPGVGLPDLRQQAAFSADAIHSPPVTIPLAGLSSGTITAIETIGIVLEFASFSIATFSQAQDLTVGPFFLSDAVPDNADFDQSQRFSGLSLTAITGLEVGVLNGSHISPPDRRNARVRPSAQPSVAAADLRLFIPK